MRLSVCGQMMFVKKGGKPGQAPHQDEFYIPTRDRSLCGAWIALDDATVENGCLWVIPGSHKHGIIWPMEKHDDPRYDVSPISCKHPYSDEHYVPVPLSAGDSVFFNGYLLHKSLNNTTDGYRRAFANHYMSATSMLPWSNDGRLPHTEDMRDIMLVAGTDPYEEWSPVEDLLEPFVRAESADDNPDQLDGLLHKA